MFEKFGKMTFDDLNRTAEGLKMEGDVESLVLLAEENGLEKEDAEDYADGVVDTLANPLEAAMGKIKVESEHLNLRCSTTLSGMRDLVTYMISRDEEMQVAVHDPEKSLAKCLGKLVAEASRTRYKLPDEIAIAAGIPTVYSDRYYERIRTEETYILFLRRDPKKAWYTLEIEPGGTVRQKRSEYNRQPDLDTVNEYLKEWQTEIKKRLKARDKQLAAQSAQQRAEEMEQLKNGTERNRQLFDLLMNDLMEVGA